MHFLLWACRGAGPLFARPSHPWALLPTCRSSYALPPDGLVDSPFEPVRTQWCRVTYPRLDCPLAVFPQLLSIYILCFLTGTCNGHEHLSPLRSSHASLLESPRRKENSDAKNGDRTDEPGRTYSVLTNVSSWSG
jgi:hypothetical protein